MWLPIDLIKDYPEPNFLIAWSDANLLSLINSKNNYLWSHSVQTIEKFIRKKQLIPFYKFKPKLILESKYHYKNNPCSLFKYHWHCDSCFIAKQI